MIQCPHCRNSLEDTGELAGQLVSCPFCARQFQMPVPQAITSFASTPAYRSRRERGPQNSPGAALVLSFLYCGLGQLYNGDFVKGLGMMLAGPLCIAACFIHPAAIFGAPVIYGLLWLYGMGDAFYGAENYNRRRR